ncbi:hypothetical protein [Sporosarcina sp. NPDC096371]|uniref:hypothetical protein n=1 Tax=Sporosarcina sp. NPDC096371 TaxID=3364530 RepID=UPI003826B994
MKQAKKSIDLLFFACFYMQITFIGQAGNIEGIFENQNRTVWVTMKRLGSELSQSLASIYR